MKLNKKKLILDIGLLTISYLLLFYTWYFDLLKIFLPSTKSSLETDAQPQLFFTIQNYFEKNTHFIFILLFALLLGSFYLLWHRIAKRNETAAHVLRHTYNTNFGYFFLKEAFVFTFFPLIPSILPISTSPLLYEIYLTIFLHTIFIILLFIVHHKNIMFGFAKKVMKEIEY